MMEGTRERMRTKGTGGGRSKTEEAGEGRMRPNSEGGRKKIGGRGWIRMGCRRTEEAGCGRGRLEKDGRGWRRSEKP